MKTSLIKIGKINYITLLSDARNVPVRFRPQQRVKVTVDLQRPNFANFFFFVPDIAKIWI